MLGNKKNFNWKTLPEMFFKQSEINSSKPLLWFKKENRYHPLTWRNIENKIKKLSLEIKKIGLRNGDRVLIISENNPNWFIADFAVMASGCITVPTYTTYTKEDFKYIINDSNAKLAFISNERLFKIFIQAADKNKNIKNINTFEKVNNKKKIKKVIYIEEIFKKKENTKKFSIDKKNNDDEACIIYTSGTSGKPKGVVLTHKSILANLEGSIDVFNKSPLKNERFISFLPLSHSYEHTAGQFLPVATSSQIFYAENLEKLFINIKEVNPTIISAVPRLYETIYKKILNNIFKKKNLIQKLFKINLKLGKTKYEDKKNYRLSDKIIKFLLSLIFDKKIKKIFGSKLKFLISGGGALSYEINIFFESLGIKILQGYGLTETSPTVSCNRPELNKIGTVGPVIQGLNIKLAKDGEILVKGDSVMKYYWKNNFETKKKIKKNWFYTGDIGEIDSDNYLKITDRKKDIIVTTGGDNIAPQKIENLLTSKNEISKVVIYGDNKPFLIALIVVNEDAIKKNLIQEKINKIIKDTNDKLSTIEKIRKFIIVKDDFTQENGLLTPTMKIKKNLVFEKFNKQIQNLYN